MSRTIVLPTNSTADFNRGTTGSPLSAPAALSVTPNNTEATITWAAVANAIRYHIYYDTSPGVTTADNLIEVDANATMYTHTGLTNGTTYYYRVAALGAAGLSALSTEDSGTPAAFTNTKSLQFLGVNRSVSFGDNYDFSPAVAWSYSFWAKPNNFGAQRAFLTKTTADANVYGVGIYHTTASKIFVQMRAAGQLRQHTSNDSLTTDWQHVVITYDGSQNISGLRIYINAIADSGGAPASGSLTNSLETTTPLYLGQRNGSFYYAGNLNQVSYWDKALSQAEVTQLYNSGTPGNIGGLSFVGDCVSWWRLADPTNFPYDLDTIGSVDGTLLNHVVGDYVSDVP